MSCLISFIIDNEAGRDECSKLESLVTPWAPIHDSLIHDIEHADACVISSVCISLVIVVLLAFVHSALLSKYSLPHLRYQAHLSLHGITVTIGDIADTLKPLSILFYFFLICIYH